MNKKVVKGYLRLMRPPNLPTAVADILAGAAISGLVQQIAITTSGYGSLLFLVGATICLYAGGVVLNDVFDYKIDIKERPERALPSGLISLKNAAIFGSLLLFTGVIFAFMASTTSGGIAIILAFAIILYDSVSKHNSFLGPINMGVCRGLNLVLGMSGTLLTGDWLWLSLIPVVYIAAVTLISRGEVHGGNKRNIVFSGALYLAVILTVSYLIFSLEDVQVIASLLFLLLFSLSIYIPLFKAYKNNIPGTIKKAVIAGVLSIVLLDAAIAVNFTFWWYGLLIVCLLPVSMGLAKLFAVT
ncbi:UbiA-like protein EboC [Aquimarina sp. ERC-38]|uniref:UbiA-like protein EboC n=1 Tax=Aquimarina sp. ERC-38 TaxID=2949996 RepID=UPI0022472CA5|nr:UbiA-like protein EboC [Aquimarina sp. ERC-38]UZO80577.1 UbiA-like protein EboC [Aquimarina sp. ERC-38]